jgi:hypothetical protein
MRFPARVRWLVLVLFALVTALVMAAGARAAHDGEARQRELDEGLELRGLLGGAPGEEPHGWLLPTRQLLRWLAEVDG